MSRIISYYAIAAFCLSTYSFHATAGMSSRTGPAPVTSVPTQPSIALPLGESFGPSKESSPTLTPAAGLAPAPTSSPTTQPSSPSQPGGASGLSGGSSPAISMGGGSSGGSPVRRGGGSGSNPPGSVVCSLPPLNASAPLQACIEQAQNQVLIPAGQYELEATVMIRKAGITLQTLGREEGDPKCNAQVDFTQPDLDPDQLNDPACATLKAAPTLLGPVISVQPPASDVTLAWLVISGRGRERRRVLGSKPCEYEAWGVLKQPQFVVSFNDEPVGPGGIHQGVNRSGIVNSNVVDAYCHGLFHHGDGEGLFVLDNVFYMAGAHHQILAWATAIGIDSQAWARVMRNTTVNATDAAMQIVSCAYCAVTDNFFFQGAGFHTAVHFVLNFGCNRSPCTSDFFLTLVARNAIRCLNAPGYHSCPIGIAIGQDRSLPPDKRTPPALGGSFVNNVIEGATIGIEMRWALDPLVQDNVYINTRSDSPWLIETNFLSSRMRPSPGVYVKDARTRLHPDSRFDGEVVTDPVDVTSWVPNVAGTLGLPWGGPW